MENIEIFGQQGWICPKCGRVFSPFITMCPYCKKEDTTNLPNNIPLSGGGLQKEM